MKVIFLTVLSLFIIGLSSAYTQEIEKAIEGKYIIANSFDDNPKYNAGHITLSNGIYRFDKNPKCELKYIKNHFLYKHPKGTYTLKYWLGINDKTQLNELDDGDILYEINIISDSDKTVDLRLLRYDKEINAIYFHSRISEVEFWHIFKNLD